MTNTYLNSRNKSVSIYLVMCTPLKQAIGSRNITVSLLTVCEALSGVIRILDIWEK